MDVTKNFSEKAVELFAKGHSCSESVVKAAYETGIIDQSLDPEFLNMIASPFSSAMGNNECLCGAVAGSQIILGLIFGRKNSMNDPHKIKKIAAEFNNKFKEKRKVTCCRALRAKFKDDPIARSANCMSIVKECADILQAMIEERACVSVA